MDNVASLFTEKIIYPPFINLTEKHNLGSCVE